MKLTKYMREAFVRSAMNDVPQIDYSEAIRKEVVRASIAVLPESVQAVWLNEETKKYVNTIYRSCNGESISVPGIGSSWDSRAMSTLLAADHKLILEMVKKAKAQAEQLESLRVRLMGAATSCTTRKALANLLPEFEKYLPADEPAACRSLPVITNIMADFTKAGWPIATKKASAK